MRGRLELLGIARALPWRACSGTGGGNGAGGGSGGGGDGDGGAEGSGAGAGEYMYGASSTSITHNLSRLRDVPFHQRQARGWQALSPWRSTSSRTVPRRSGAAREPPCALIRPNAKAAAATAAAIAINVDTQALLHRRSLQAVDCEFHRRWSCSQPRGTVRGFVTN